MWGAPGRGLALRTAWGASSAAVVAYMDVDLSTELDALLPLVAPLLSGRSDLAIGSRLAPGARVTRSVKREMISRCYNLIIRRALRTRVTDAQCGFKALRNDVARQLLPMVADDSWFFDTELVVRAERYGLASMRCPSTGWRTRLAGPHRQHRLGRPQGHPAPAPRPGGGTDPFADPDRGRVGAHPMSAVTFEPPGVEAAADRGGRSVRTPRRGSGLLRGRPYDPAWVRPALLGLLVATGVLYLWDLSASGWANSFYSAAVQAGTKSWKAFFFGSFDSSNFITVDKSPAALWVMELSARVFGVNSWSILVPNALEGVATVGLLYATVRRWFSPAPPCSPEPWWR